MGCYIFQNFHIIQGTVNKQSINNPENVFYQQFVSIDEATHKLLVNLEWLGEFDDDKIHFIGLIEHDRDIDCQQNIMISEKPFFINNGISYFLLKTNNCEIEILRIMYLLAHALYVDSTFLSDIQFKISKITTIQQGWNIPNYLYVISKSYDSLSGIHTSAETRQLVYRQSKDLIYEKEQAISYQLELYFTQIYVLSMKSNATQLESVRENLKSQNKHYSEHFPYYFIYKGIVKGFQNINMHSKQISIRYFHEVNLSQICSQLVDHVKNNYQLFSQSIFDEDEDKDKNQIYKIVKNFKKEAFRPMMDAKKINWLAGHSKFISSYNNTKSQVNDRAAGLLNILIMKSQNASIKIIEQEISKDISEILGNQKLNDIGLQFSVYKEQTTKHLRDLFKMIIKNEWKEEGKTIKSKRELLHNLETRLEINHNKKKGLIEAIRLAEKEYQSLSQLPVK